MKVVVALVLFAVLLAVVALGALGDWWLAGAGPAAPGGDAPAPEAAGTVPRPDGTAGGEDPEAAPPNQAALYERLAGRHLHARLRVTPLADAAAVTIPALPAAGGFRYTVAGNEGGPLVHRVARGRYRTTGPAEQPGLELHDCNAAGTVVPGPLRFGFEAGILRLSGAENQPADLRADLREAGRQLLFLQRNLPATTLSPGDAVACGAERFLVLPAPGEAPGLLLAAADACTLHEGAPRDYPATAGALNEMRYRPPAGADPGHRLVRLQAHRSEGEGVFALRCLELDW